MDLISKKIVKKLLLEQKTMPQKKFGQNFLIDKGAISKLINAADIKKDDTVIEIGPGIGNLTQELAKKAKKVISVEKDVKMMEILKETLKNFGNIELLQGDARRIGDWGMKARDYKVAANIPFYLTAPLIRNFLEAKNPPKEMTLLIQKEVAQRICAKPPDMNLLAVSVQFYAKPKIITHISKKSFWPAPKVDGAIIKITEINNIKPDTDKELFFKIVKAGFSQPRKQLLNNLSAGLKTDREKTKSWLSQNGIQPIQRAETLSIGQWIDLTKSFIII